MGGGRGFRLYHLTCPEVWHGNDTIIMTPRPTFYALQCSVAHHGHGGESNDIWRARAASRAQRARPLYNYVAGHQLWCNQAIAHAAGVQGTDRSTVRFNGSQHPIEHSLVQPRSAEL